MTFRICIVTKAMEAYQSFCQNVPEYIEGSGPYTPLGIDHVAIIIATAESHARGFPAWFKSYRESQPSEWWKLKSGEEISLMLHDLPMTEEAWCEVSELVKCIQLMAPADGSNDS